MEVTLKKTSDQSAQRGGSISSQRWHARAVRAAESGQLVEAAHAAKKAITTGCRRRDAGSLLVTSYWRLFQLPECIAAYDEHFGFDPEWWRDRPDLGATRAYVDAMMRQGAGDRAVEHMTRLTKCNPSCAVYWELLGFAALNHDTDLAINALQTAWNRNRRVSKVLLWLLSAMETADRTPEWFKLDGLQEALRNGSAIGEDGHILQALYEIGDRVAALQIGLNRHLRAIGAAEIAIDPDAGGWGFDHVRPTAACTPDTGGPLVSMIVTAHNEAACLGATVRSLLRQRHANIEVLLVDDGSRDETATMMRSMAQDDERVRCLLLPKNVGLFAAKNFAFGQANGAFIGFFDADDWAHPELLSRKLATLQKHQRTMAVVSSRIRVTPGWRFHIRRPGRVIHRDPASMLIRRELIEEIGYHDWLRSAADSELLNRIRRAYGPDGLIWQNECLALSSWDATSTSGTHGGGFNRDGGNSHVINYYRRFLNWHQSCAIGDHEALRVAWFTERRPFLLPTGWDVDRDRLKHAYERMEVFP